MTVALNTEQPRGRRNRWRPKHDTRFACV